MKIYDREGNPISIGTVVGRGGEAVVYRVIGRPAWLAKIYEPAPRPNYAAKLAWMLEHPPANPTHALNHPSLAWPAGLLYGQGNRLAGYLMPYIQQAVPVLVVFNPRRRVETLAQFDRRYLHRAARNLATAAGALHTSGYVVGDLNESNVLVTPSALVTLIDTDSFQVQEPRGGQVVTYACPVAKPEYTPPELQGKSLSSTVRSPEQDAFSLGVLIFQLLMEGNHPFRAQWLGKGDPPPIEERIALGGFPYTSTPGVPVRPPKYAPDLDLLHPEISELVRRCFIDGHRDPRLRPEASAWEWAIAEAEKSLVQCPNRHFYSEHLRGCPVCHAPACSGWRSSLAHLPGAPPGCYIPPGWIQRTCRAANCYSRSKTVCRTSGGQTSQPAGLHGCQPNTHQQENSLQHSSTPSERCLHWLAATCSRTAQPASSDSGPPYSGYTAPGARTANAPGAKHLPGGATSSGHPAGQAVRSGWIDRRPLLGWWSSQRIQAGATGVGNVQILAGSTGPGATDRARIRAVGIPPGTAGKSSLENMEILAGTAGAGSAAIAGATTGGSTCSAAPRSPGSTGPTGARQPWSGPKYKFCNAADWSRQRTADPAARRSRCTDPAKYSRSGNSSAGRRRTRRQRSARQNQPLPGTRNLAWRNRRKPLHSPRRLKIRRPNRVRASRTQPPPSRPAAQPAQPQPPATGARQAAPPHSQPPRPAPPYASPQPGRPAYSRPAAAPAQPANSLLNWAGPRLYKSLAIGGGLGALAGALPGALVGVAGWSTGSMASWVLLWALGGATAGLLRGWQPGYRMSLRVDQAVGWQRVWPAFGVLAGAALGGFIGLALGWWAVFPVFLGLAAGSLAGAQGWPQAVAGRRPARLGAHLGWGGRP